MAHGHGHGRRHSCGNRVALARRRIPATFDRLVLAPSAYRAALGNASSLATDVFGGRFCGGVLAAASLVLTVRHCIQGLKAAQIDAMVGANNLCRDVAIDGERRRVAGDDVPSAASLQ